MFHHVFASFRMRQYMPGEGGGFRAGADNRAERKQKTQDRQLPPPISLKAVELFYGEFSCYHEHWEKYDEEKMSG
ncbi:hypothetical protein [Paenibacillus beijingensis]|uniref:hypothetical protein n=1 Tax=Paenibacillus beijingensis TaxID=1126833 RepID=UPI0011DD2B8F|nr:hypothetical protein [Paenibacillus beijingensis]